MSLDRRNLAAGAIFAAIGALFFTLSFDLAFGTSLRMGPAFFPRILAGILILIGVVVAAQPSSHPDDATFVVPWRGLVLILSAPIIFGLTARGIGLVPAVFLISLTSAFASRRMTLAVALAIAAGLAAFCWLVFKVGLKVNLPTIGPWLGG